MKRSIGEDCARDSFNLVHRLFNNLFVGFTQINFFSFYSQRGAFVSEPAILVKRKGKGSQIWSMEKFENKIIDMRDMYEERKEKGLPMMVEDPDDEPVLYLLVCVVCMAF